MGTGRQGGAEEDRTAGDPQGSLDPSRAGSGLVSQLGCIGNSAWGKPGPGSVARGHCTTGGSGGSQAWTDVSRMGQVGGACSRWLRNLPSVFPGPLTSSHSGSGGTAWPQAALYLAVAPQIGQHPAASQPEGLWLLLTCLVWAQLQTHMSSAGRLHPPGNTDSTTLTRPEKHDSHSRKSLSQGPSASC